MFGLIPFAITIILVAVVTAGFMFLSGDIFTESSSNARAVQYQNQADAIVSAINMYTFTEKKRPTVPELVTDVIGNPTYYKGGREAVGNWNIPPVGFTNVKGVVLDVESIEVCKAVNANIGYTSAVPSCTAVPPELANESRYYCCTN